MSAEMLAERKEKKKRVDSNFKCIERLFFFSFFFLPHVNYVLISCFGILNHLVCQGLIQGI